MGLHTHSVDFMRALRLDKKRVEKQIEFVLIDRLGHAFTRKMLIGDILSMLT